MAGRAAVPLLCYWDGQVRNGAEGIDYDGPPPRVIRAAEEININELVEKIYGITGWDKQHFELEITGRYLAGTTPTRYFIALPIVDDASIASMFDMTRSPHLGWNCIQLYLKKNPATPDNHLDASENVQSGSFTRLLTQGGEASVFHSSAIFDERRSPSVSADSIGVEDHSEDILAGPTPINYNKPQMNAAKDVTHVVESNTDICNDLRGDNEKALVPDSTNDDQVDKTVISENVPQQQQQQQQQQLSLQNEEELFVGRKFATKEELQRAVKLYSIKAHHQYTVRDSRPDLYVLKCKQSPDCPWYLRALVRNEKSCFEITRLKGPHTCVDPIINKDHVQLDSGFIANEVKDFVKAGLSVAAIQKVIASRFSHKISYRKAWAARQKAMAQLLSDNEGSSQPSQAKARPGRPKKQQQQQSGDNVESSQPSQVKAGRGRPKKKKQADDDDAGMSQQLSQAEASPAPKRKRKKSTS